MIRIRAFTTGDIPAVARLHQTVFRTGQRPDPGVGDDYRDYFARVFLEGPLNDPAIPSLVAEGDDGRVAGFLGVVTHRVAMGGRPFRAAVSSQFVVDPNGPAGLVALRVVRAFLDGAQDVSIADEATSASQKIWEGLGGATARLLSLRWIRPLRPARFATNWMARRRGLRGLAGAFTPVATVADAIAIRLPRNVSRSQPVTSAADLDAAEILEQRRTFASDTILSVDDDEEGLAWLLSRAEQRSPDRLRKVVLTMGRKVVGWFIWHFDADGTADVLQLQARPSSIHQVLEHLFYDAAGRGATAVTGRFEPRFLAALSDKYCVFYQQGVWALVHARTPQLLQAFSSGDTSFSRLDGEWPLAFTASAASVAS